MAKTLEIESRTGQAVVPLPAAPSTTFGSFIGAPARLLRAGAREWRFRRAANELRQMDDRVLRDIGIDRGEIVRASRYGRETY